MKKMKIIQLDDEVDEILEIDDLIVQTYKIKLLVQITLIVNLHIGTKIVILINNIVLKNIITK